MSRFARTRSVASGGCSVEAAEFCERLLLTLVDLVRFINVNALLGGRCLLAVVEANIWNAAFMNVLFRRILAQFWIFWLILSILCWSVYSTYNQNLILILRHIYQILQIYQLFLA